MQLNALSLSLYLFAPKFRLVELSFGMEYERRHFKVNLNVTSICNQLEMTNNL